MLKINLRLLEKKDLPLAGEIPPGELGLEDTPDEVFGPVAYDLQATRPGGGVLLRGRVATVLRTTCGRCLAAFDLALAANDVCHFYEHPQGEEIDVAPDLREDLLIILPLKRLCRESCRGLCPVCGGDRNRRACRCAVPGVGQDLWAALDSLPES
jgi:uncharacterized protein